MMNKDFFNQGHPEIQLESKSGDAWIVLLELVESVTGKEIWDQDGGEFDVTTLKEEDGVVTIDYVLYGICIDEGDEPKDIPFQLSGVFNNPDKFVVQDIKFNFK